jgi:hypothetical protein|tara:strand:- start:252 stop:449 length:198 start_codon:yes stop_codon:yes gene_type:complete
MDIDRLRVLAGVNKSVAESPEGSNISIVGSEKAKIQRERKIKPGTDEWFKLWFSRPHLTGEKPTK